MRIVILKQHFKKLLFFLFLKQYLGTLKLNKSVDPFHGHSRAFQLALYK